MASLHKDPRGKSPYWYCAFYGADGLRKFKSTKSTSRKDALRVCIEWSAVAEKARGGKLYAAQARKVLNEILSTATGESLTEFTLSEWFKQFLANKKGSATPATIARYKQVLGDFEEYLGARARGPLAGVTPSDLTTYRDKLRKEGRAVSTVNLTVRKILSVPFESARKLGYIITNPVAAVDEVKDKEEARAKGRESFSTDEICLLLAAAGESEWRGLILLALTSGLRLGDASRLTWGCVDFGRKVLTIITQKTDTEIVIPIHTDFFEWLEMQHRGIGKAPVFPQLSKKTIGGRPGLSAGFKLLMEKAEIKSRAFVRKGEGRTTFSKGFHSFRHTYISSLANAGVAPDIRQKLVGHSDAKVHAQYTHHELQTLRTAIEKIPSVSVQT